MGRVKAWLCRRFLPAWCREEMLEELRRLTEALEEERQRNRELRAYAEGMAAVLGRLPRRVIIKNKEGKGAGL